MSKLPMFLRCVILFTCLAFSYVFLIYITPYVATTYFPNWQKYHETAAENDIETGALFYSDLPVSSEAFYNFGVILREEY